MKVSIILNNRHLRNAGIIFLWIIIWQGCYMLVGEDLLLASPAAVFSRILRLAGTLSFWNTIRWTLSRILCGFFLGLVFGTLAAFAAAKFRWLDAFLSLPMNVIKSTPVASFVILALVWIDGRNLSIFIAFLMVLPIVWYNVRAGIRSVDSKLLEMAAVFRVGRLEIFRKITLPAVLPHFLSAVKTGLGFSWKAGIAGEVLAIPANAIGTRLYNAKVYWETTDLFAWTIVIILLSMVLEHLIIQALNRISDSSA